MSNMLDLEALLDDESQTPSEGNSSARWGGTGMAPASIWRLRGQVPAARGRGIAFLPIIPSAFAIGAFLRYFRGLDELRRPIQLEAVAFSFLTTCLIPLTWTFPQNAGPPAL
jgi:hypothetical protein